MVKWRTWKAYLRAAGHARVAVVGGLLVAAQALIMAADYQLADVVRGAPFTRYALLCAGGALAAVLRAVGFFAMALRASTSLHGRAFSSVVATPMWWFNANPLGRILNRFTGDLNHADEQLAASLFETLQLGLMALGALGAVVLVAPWLLVLLPLVVVGMGWLRQYTTRSLRELKRLDGVSKSPLHTQLAQVGGSLVALRAYGQQAALRARFEERLDQNAATWWWWLVCNRAFGTMLDLISSSVLIVVVAVAVWSRAADTAASPSDIAFSLTYALSLSGLLQYVRRPRIEHGTFHSRSLARTRPHAEGLTFDPWSSRC
jgi:ATP-binding cassette subfamily C (CFTR/MRP) protein 4